MRKLELGRAVKKVEKSNFGLELMVTESQEAMGEVHRRGGFVEQGV